METSNGSTTTEALDTQEFKARQRKLKATYAESPELAKQTTVVHSVTPDDARVGKVRIAIDGVPGCEVDIGAHVSVGGTEDTGCSGDYFLASLAGCYEVTLRLVASSLGLTLNCVDLQVEGDWDSRGTLAVDKEAPVGYTAIRVIADVDAEGPERSLARLGELTERYCVVSQTLKTPPSVEVTWK